MAGTSYTRQSTIADGNIITAALFNNEFNQLLNAFAYASSGTTGHSHDGSAGQGAAISKIGDQDFNNKIVISAANNRIEFYSEVSGSPVEQVRIQDGAIVPVTDSDVDLGTTSVRFKDAYIDSTTVTGTVTANAISTSANSTLAGATFASGADVTFTGAAYNAVWDSSTNTLRFADNAVMAVGDSSELKIYHDGSNSYIKEAGTGSLFVTADTNIFMGSSNGAYSFSVDGTGGTTTRVAGTTTLTVDSDGVSVPDNVKINLGNSDDLQIFHDGSNSRITDTGTGNLYLTGANNISLLSNATTYGVFGTSVDLYYSNSKKFETTSAGATVSGDLSVSSAVSTQAVLAGVNVDTPRLEVTNLFARDGSAAGSIADSTGVVTLNSAVLTTADINGGTIDGSVIGGSTAAAGTFTTINGTTSTVTTSNATTVDTTNLEVTNIKAKDGTSAGSIADSTGVVTLASSVLTTADINGGTADNVVIGGSTAAAGNFTTIGATGEITGTDVTLTDASPVITLNDSDGTDTFSRIRQVTGSLKIESRNNTGHGAIEFETRNNSVTKTRLKIGTNGDINFYDVDGSTIGAKWDASSARLGIGVTSPTQALDVVGSIKTTTGVVFADASSSGTSTSNTLNDYEEGSWTPVMRDATSSGNVAGTSSITGLYTKIGRQVTLTIRVINVSKTGLTGGNNIYITGLPFAATDLTSAFRHIGNVESTRIDFSTSIQTRITENTSYMMLSSSTANGGLSTIDWDAVDADESGAGVADLFITHTYIAD